MKLVDVGKLKIAPFEFERILELKIERNINEHAVLYVRGVIIHNWKDRPVSEAKEGTNVKCEVDKNTYFNGVLQSVMITCEDAVYYLEAHAISHTIKLDTIKHKRSFQDNGEAYESIIKAISGEKNGVVHYHADTRTVERILVQYDETDWEFAKRLASHTQDVLTAVSSSDKPEFHVGTEDEKYAGEIISANYSVFKNFDLLRLRSNDEIPLIEDDITMYQVKTYDFSYASYDVGEKVLLNGIKDLYIRHAILSLEESHLVCLYTLSSKNAVTAPKIYNKNIIGLALQGTVKTVENDNVKLDLDIDYKSGPAHFFKYATDYSPESHTGWYVMPETGDTVHLIFTSGDERDAFSASSIRMSGTSKTGDPATKFLRTPFGKEVKLDSQEVLITAVDDDTFIRVSESGIDIITSQPITIVSDDTMDITSTGDMTISTEGNLSMSSVGDMSISADGNMSIAAKGDMSITTDQNLTVDATASIDVTNMGNNTNFDPGSGIAISTDQVFDVQSTGDANIDTKANMNLSALADQTLTATGNTTIESSANLAASGIQSVTVSNGGTNVMSMNAIGVNVNAAPLLTINSVGALMLSGLDTTVSAMVFLRNTAPKVTVAGMLGADMLCGASSVKMNPGMVTIKGGIIREN